MVAEEASATVEKQDDDDEDEDEHNWDNMDPNTVDITQPPM